MTATLEQPDAPSTGAGYHTVAARVREWAERTPDGVAMREKDYGIWREYSWATTWDLIETAAHGLLALGVDVGDRVSIHAEDRPEWVILDLATVAVRGISVGFYPTNPTAEVQYLLEDCGACVHFAEDEEQYDKVDEIDPERIPNVRRIIFVEPRGMVGKTDERLLFWDAFLDLGREHRDQHPNALAERMAAADSTR